MLSPTKKCSTVALRELFMGILCLATLSFLLTYQLGQSGIYVDSEETRNKEFPSHVLASSDSNNGKIFGRSLNMHDTGIERAEQRPTSLLSRLLQLEEKLLKHTRHRKIGVAGLSQDTLDDEDWLELQKTARRFGQDIALIEDKKPLSKTDRAFIQRNNSMILCAGDLDSCPEALSNSVGDFQRMNRVSAIEKELCDPAKLCEVSSLKENAGRTVDNSCHTVSRSQADELYKKNMTFTVVVAFENSHVVTVLRDSSVPPLLHRERSNVSTIWTIGDPLLTFQSGPLLRLKFLVASFSPLRVYLYPTAAIGPVDALAEPSLFQDKVTYEEILQYIGENYGLSASNQWWNTIQILLMKMLISVEEQKDFASFSRSTRCFGVYSADLLCVTMRQCYIIQMKPMLSHMANYKHDLLEPVLHLMTSERMVATDVANAIDELKRNADIKVCEDDVSFGCLTDGVLIYFLENRRESLSNTELIKIYPTTTSSIFTPFMSDLNAESFGFNNPNTVRLHPLLISSEIFYSKSETTLPENIDVSGDVEMYGEKLNLDYLEQPLNDSGLNKQGSCSEDPRHYKELAEIQTEPALHFQQYSLDQFYAAVDYDVILIKVWASARHCCCQVRLGDVFEPSRPTNFTLGLGENIIKLLIVKTDYAEPKTIQTVKLYVVRESRGRLEDRTEFESLTTCSLKQDCALPFSQSVPCGLQYTFTQWGQFQKQQKPLCTKGDAEGSWTIPCTDCRNVNSCYWKLARWQPDTCDYRQLSESEIRQCLVNKKLLFLGDSTNRGIMHYIIEKINGSLYTMDKTHTIKVYPDLNGGRTNSSFAYYPHFWLPAKHRPKFHKVLYQLIKRSFPLENNSNTVLVMGGVHWLAKRHIDVILEAIKRLGLSNITKVVKGIGAGFHQNIQGVRYVNKDNQAKLLLREQEVLNYAKRSDFKVVGTFNMTMARYKDFTQGKCACHFHKISKQKDTAPQRYRVEGDINAAYSQILLHNICNLS